MHYKINHIKVKDSIITIIGNATIEITEVSVAPSVEIHNTSVKLVANSTNWRKVVKDLIGDEPVTYSERSKKDTLRKFPIVNIASPDKEALDRVLTKAAEVE